MLKLEYIALRFVAQDAYERAARMRIPPAPDVVTCVFTLFPSVLVGDFWANVVGVGAVRVADSGFLRVPEWGGIENQ